MQIFLVVYREIYYNGFMNNIPCVKEFRKIKEDKIMVQIISGKKGKGKTKYLLEKANQSAVDAKGSVVYLDKSTKHMYELSRQVRLINVMDYDVNSFDVFVGFILGIISQDHDLEIMYLDSFLKVADLEGKDITEAVAKLDEVGEKFHVSFVLSVSEDKENLSEEVQKHVVIAL